jgi:hypothetical protein
MALGVDSACNRNGYQESSWGEEVKGGRRLGLTLLPHINTGFLDFVHLEFRTMDKVQKPNINECYTPSSEPYRVYSYHNLWVDCLENMGASTSYNLMSFHDLLQG